MFKKWPHAALIFGTLLVCLTTGCVTTTPVITNLTPLQQPRSETGMYTVEMSFISRQQSLRWDSIKPHVVIGTEFYPMTRTPIMRNRWEALIPVPAHANSVTYRYKVDFKSNEFGYRGEDSAFSREYKLTIID